MAAIPILIVGTMKDNDSSEEKQVTITGLASIQGLGVGGGPVYPPYPSHPIYNPGGPPGSSPPGFWGGGMGPGVKPQPPFPGGGGGDPPGIWGPPGPWPTPPIAFPPGWIGGLPPGGGGGGGGEEQPKFEVKVGWSAETGWVVVLVPQFPHPTPSS